MSAQAEEHKTMTLKLIVWRQPGPKQPGRFETYTAKNITEHHSFLEMLDVVNEDLIKEGKEPIAFDHDCREGICGMCSTVVNGVPDWIVVKPETEVRLAGFHPKVYPPNALNTCGRSVARRPLSGFPSAS